MRELLPMVLSIILFLITMVVIATLRKADERNRKVDYIKKYVNNFSENMKQSGQEIETKVVEVESKLHQVVMETSRAVATIQKEKEELFSHVKDLEELQSTVLEYHEVLTSLSSMTEDVENRLVAVKEDIDEIKQVEHLIADFSILIEESKEAMDHHHQALHQSFGIYQQKIETLIESSHEQLVVSFSQKKDEFTHSVNPLLTKMNSIASSLFREAQSHVEKVEQEIEYLQKATSISLSELKQHVGEKEKELEAEHAALITLKGEREAIKDEIRALQENKNNVQTELHELVDKKSTSIEELDNLNNRVRTSKEELVAINDDIELSKDELLSLEDEIALALRLKEQQKKEEEIAYLLQREEVDYPTFDDEEEENLEPLTDQQSFDDELQEELFDTIDPYDEKEVSLYDETKQTQPTDEEKATDPILEIDEREEKDKKKKYVEPNYIQEDEEDEIEIIIDDEDEDN